VFGVFLFIATLILQRGKVAQRSKERVLGDPRAMAGHSDSSVPVRSDQSGKVPVLGIVMVGKTLWIFGSMLLLAALVLYGAWVQPRVRYVAFAATVTFVALLLMRRVLARRVSHQ